MPNLISLERKTRQVDWCSRRGALELAQRIVSYWNKRGAKNVFVNVVKVSRGDTAGVNCVFAQRSNLVNGLPPR